MTTYQKGLMTLIALFIPLALGCPATSQEVRPMASPEVQPAASTDLPSQDMEILLDKLRADKKLLVSQNMGLTSTEGRDFWPVYDRFQKDLAGIANRKIKLISDYADNYETMSDGVARDILDRFLTIEGDQLKLRKSYLSQFRKVLADKKVARYYQLENKIQALVNFQLAANIPLVQ